MEAVLQVHAARLVARLGACPRSPRPSSHHGNSRAPPPQSPADFRIDLHPPPDLPLPLLASNSTPPPTAGQYTRHTYARIRLVDTGVRTPGRSPPAAFTAAAPAVPFLVVLEPLVAGALPASLVPTLLVLAALVPLAALVARALHGVLAAAARDARRELASAAANRA